MTNILVYLLTPVLLPVITAVFPDKSGICSNEKLRLAKNAIVEKYIAFFQ
jgi:hypothetical protein